MLIQQIRIVWDQIDFVHMSSKRNERTVLLVLLSSLRLQKWCFFIVNESYSMVKAAWRCLVIGTKNVTFNLRKISFPHCKITSGMSAVVGLRCSVCLP